ncbi:MAG: Uma2 family endonuclease [Deinococcales bacterium]
MYNSQYMPSLVDISPIAESESCYVRLKGLTWATYKSMLQDWGDERHTLLAYHQGILDIFMPSEMHEIIKAFRGSGLSAAALELNMPFKATGSITFNREDLSRGVEPDASFYFQNAYKVRGHHIDLSQQPPPDLVIEVDISHPSKVKFPIYLALGVPEIWLYDKEIYIYHLKSGVIS